MFRMLRPEERSRVLSISWLKIDGFIDIERQTEIFFELMTMNNT